MALFLYTGALISLNGGAGFTVERSDGIAEISAQGKTLVHVAVVDPKYDGGFSLTLYRRLSAYFKDTFPGSLQDGSFWVNSFDLSPLGASSTVSNGMHGSHFDNHEFKLGNTDWTTFQAPQLSVKEIFGGRRTPLKGSIRITPSEGPEVTMSEDRFIFIDGSNTQNNTPPGHAFLILDRYLTGSARELHQFKDWSRLAEEMLDPEKFDIISPYIFAAILKNPQGPGYLALIPPKIRSVEGHTRFLGQFETVFKALCEHIAFHILLNCDFPGKEESAKAFVDFNFTDEFLDTTIRGKVH